ncbi:SDR family NAD(P)-dependent oxidoreductase [Streptomyces gardneri]|uniref:SDR family NAD(P)-dependent oxidoreductase n=1 Tax=Streptomyces gardneri TaxID=66892 RepID=UPI0036B4F21A
METKTPRYQIAGRTVVLTGSTSDLGDALARALCNLGARLALLDLDGQAAFEQAAQLGNETTARAWQADVRDLGSLTTAFDAAASHFGRVDIAIANASIDSFAPLEIIEPALYERMIDVNLNGVWRTFRAALPHVSEQHGYLLATSSMASDVRSPVQIPYGASKAAVWAMCNSLRLEVRRLGVDVGSVHPALFTPPKTDKLRNDATDDTCWTGHATTHQRATSLDTVVQSIITGIEGRAPQIVAPRSPGPTARPGLVRPYVGRRGHTDSSLPRAIDHVDPTNGTAHELGTPAAARP